MRNPDLTTSYRFHRQQTPMIAGRDRGRYWAMETPFTARQCLALARLDLVNGKKRYPTSGPAGWGNVRGDDSAVWVESLKAAGLRFVGFADDLTSRIGHKGWYTTPDHVEGEVFRGAVLRMSAAPHLDGSPRFLAAYADPNNAGAFRVDLARGVIMGVDGEPIEAAHAADRFAQIQAEREMEYQEAWQAGQRWYELGETVQQARREALRLISEAKRACDVLASGSAMRAAITRNVESMLSEIRDARAKRAKRAKILDDFNPRLAEAFNEGAGEQVFSVA